MSPLTSGAIPEFEFGYARLETPRGAIELFDGQARLAQGFSSLAGRLTQLRQCFTDLLGAGRLSMHALIDRLNRGVSVCT